MTPSSGEGTAVCVVGGRNVVGSRRNIPRKDDAAHSEYPQGKFGQFYSKIKRGNVTAEELNAELEFFRHTSRPRPETDINIQP